MLRKHISYYTNQYELSPFLILRRFSIIPLPILPLFLQLLKPLLLPYLLPLHLHLTKPPIQSLLNPHQPLNHLPIPTNLPDDYSYRHNHRDNQSHD